MRKNVLTIAILVLIGLIVVINFWRPSVFDGVKKPEVAAPTIAQGVSKIKSGSVEEGTQAPDFELTTLDGKKAKLSDYRGQKVILNFWASWCPPCKAEMPHMQKFHEKNKDNNITILSVNLTRSDRGITAVQNFIKKNKLTFPVLLDEKGDIGKTYQAFTIPTSYIIDQKGIIRKKMIGPMDEDMMKNFTDNM